MNRLLTLSGKGLPAVDAVGHIRQFLLFCTGSCHIACVARRSNPDMSAVSAAARFFPVIRQIFPRNPCCIRQMPHTLLQFRVIAAGTGIKQGIRLRLLGTSCFHFTLFSIVRFQSSIFLHAPLFHHFRQKDNRKLRQVFFKHLPAVRAC